MLLGCNQGGGAEELDDVDGIPLQKTRSCPEDHDYDPSDMSRRRFRRLFC